MTDIGDVLSRLKRERLGREHVQRDGYHQNHDGNPRENVPGADHPQGFNGHSAHAGSNGHTGEHPSLIKSSAEFVADFTPPDYVLDGILQRRFCYSLTGRTGAGKTAILLLLSAHDALENCSVIVSLIKGAYSIS